MSGINSRIDKLLAALGHNAVPADISDSEIAHRLDAILSGAIQCDREPDEQQLALAALLSPDKDGAAWLAEKRAEVEAQRAAKEEAKQADTGQLFPEGSSLNDLVRAMLPTSVPQTGSRRAPVPQSRDEEITSPSFEKARAENMGANELAAGGPRQQQAVIGTRPRGGWRK
jgi:hypothetical protein